MMLKEKYGITDKIILGVAAVWSNRKGLSTFIELERKLPKGYKIVLIGLNDRQIKELPKGILGLPKTFSVSQFIKYIPYSKKEAIMDKVKRVMVSTGLSKNLKIKKLLTKIKK